MQYYQAKVSTNLDDLEMTYEELAKIWSEFVSPNYFDYQMGLELVNVAFLSTIEQDDNQDINLNILTGGWKVKLNSGVLKTGLSMAILTGLLKMTAVTGSLAGFVLPGVIGLLFDIEKISLTKKETDIYTNLVLKPDVTKLLHEPEELYKLLPTEYQEQINYLDFLDFMEKLHLSGYAKNECRYFKLYNKARLRISFE